MSQPHQDSSLKQSELDAQRRSPHLRECCCGRPLPARPSGNRRLLRSSERRRCLCRLSLSREKADTVDLSRRVGDVCAIQARDLICAIRDIESLYIALADRLALGSTSTLRRCRCTQTTPPDVEGRIHNGAPTITGSGTRQEVEARRRPRLQEVSSSSVRLCTTFPAISFPCLQADDIQIPHNLHFKTLLPPILIPAGPDHPFKPLTEANLAGSWWIVRSEEEVSAGRERWTLFWQDGYTGA